MADSSQGADASAARKQRKDPLDSDQHGVSVVMDGDRYIIQFAYSQTLMKRAKAIPGAKWDAEAKSWTAPSREYEAVKSSVAAMRETRRSMDQEKPEIELAVSKLVNEAKIIDRHAAGSRTSGEIVALGSHFVAQKVQSKEGNIVSLHERSALALTSQFRPEALAAGQDVSVFYHNGAGLVSSRHPERAPEPPHAAEPAPSSKPRRGAAKASAPARA